MAGQDVIVVGGRVAGAATALLLARRGVRVLVLDRVGFPSDTISSHQVQVPGIARLHRWGLLERLEAAGTPPTRRVRFDAGHVVLEGRFPAVEGVDALYSPRRTVLDALLVDAARAAGAEVREHVRVDELVWSEGGVVGVRGSERGSGQVTERARLVIGADGKRSMVAEAVGARRYRERPVRSFASYTYWSGLPVTAGELYQRPGRTVAVFPTNDDLVMVYVATPMAEFANARADLERHYLEALDGCGDLGERVRSATRAERLRTTPDQPNSFRVPYGPGWALAGDAGVVMDSISAQGISNALRDAELLSAAVASGLDGSRPLAIALAEHRRRRDRAVRPMYDFTLDLAAYRPPGLAERHFLASVADRPAEIERLLGAFAGIHPVGGYFAPLNAVRTLGLRGLGGLARAALSGGQSGCR